MTFVQSDEWTKGCTIRALLDLRSCREGVPEENPRAVLNDELKRSENALVTIRVNVLEHASEKIF